jgi:hypothetical protein
VIPRLSREYVTVKEAAMLLGVSEQAVHKACRCGRIQFQMFSGVRVLERENLSARWHGSSQRRVMRAPVDLEPCPDWVAIADQLNAYLGPSWPAPPYSGDQAATVAMALSLAAEAVAGG